MRRDSTKINRNTQCVRDSHAKVQSKMCTIVGIIHKTSGKEEKPSYVGLTHKRVV